MANKIGGPGPRPTWVGRLQNNRTNTPTAKPGAGAARDRDLVGGPGAGGRPGGDDTAGRLVAAGVPEKLAAAHADALKGALAEVTGLAALTDGMAPWRKKQLDRALGQIYKVLGLQLSLAAEADRGAVAKETLGALLALAQRTGVNDHLMPVIFAATGLVDSGARLVAQKKLKMTSEEAIHAGRTACDVVTAVADALAGRSGAASALNAFPNLVEQLERAPANLTAKQRAALWKAAEGLLLQAVPKRGFDQAAAARLSELLAAELAKGTKPDKAAAAVLEDVRADSAPLHEQARLQLAVEPNGLPGGSPGRQCYDHVQGALIAVLDANPAGSDALYRQLEAFRAAANARLQNGHEDNYRGWGCAAAIVRKLADAPAIAEVLNELNVILPSLVGRPQAIAALQRAVDAPDLSATLTALVEARLGTWSRTFANYPGLDVASARLTELSPDLAIAAYAAVAPQLADPRTATALMNGLVDVAKSARPDEPVTWLASYSARFGAYANRFLAWLGAKEEVYTLAARFAAAGTGGAPPQAAIDAAAQLLRGTQNVLGRVDLSSVLESAGPNLPGVLEVTNPATRLRHPVTNFFEPLIGTLRANFPHVDAEKQTEAVRVALALTAKLANLDGEYQVPWQRIQPDYTAAFTNPAQLRFAARGVGGAALRAQQPTVSSFLDAHPELPIELALTAGLHLQPDQLAWLCEKVGTARGRDTVRSLRDFVFACVTAGRLDVLDVVRASQSPAKALSAVITEIGREYRANKLGAVPWDLVKDGLAAGGDPMGELAKQKIAAGMQGLVAAGLVGVDAHPEGMKALSVCAPAITSCIKYYEEQLQNPNTDGRIDYRPVLSAFQAVVRSVSEGTWPKVKYENEVAERLLGILTPAQREVWREEMITPLAGAAAGNDDAERATMQLLRGLVKALPEEVKLSPSLGALGFDAASAEKLSVRRDALLGELRQTEKGGPRHRELGNELGTINRNLAVIELQLALAARFGDGQAPRADEVLRELRPLLASAGTALRGLGAKGCHAAVGEALFAARDVKTSVRQGRYAVDEDGLEPMIMSHTQASGSCLNHVSGFRRWGL